MASSDDEAEAVPSTVSNYEFVDDKDEPVSFAELTFRWNDSESLDGNKKHVFLRGTADNGLQKIYKPVTTWKIDSSRIEPSISVLSKENDWIKLEKPRKAFQDTIRSILITVHSLHFLKINPESSGRALWDHLSKVLSVYEPRPSENDLVDHMNFINEIVKRDGKLAQSKVLLAFLEEKPKKKKIFDEVGAMSEFIVDEIIDDDDEEEEDESDYNHFESLCAICDDGGELLWYVLSHSTKKTLICDGKCLRSFHATVDDGAQSKCKSLGFTKARVKAMKYQDFYCKNCEYQQHQCYACGKLGSSDQSSHPEVFRCVNATCGHFYHPHCVARLLHPDAQSKVDELKKKIAAGESFTCPLHQCCVCKQREDKDTPEQQFAMCRRCPTSYHRKCLPKEIVFDKSKDEEGNDEDDEDEEEDDVLPRAWDGLIKNRILIYCLKHEIDEELATPSRDHINFPGDHRREKQASEQLRKFKGLSAEVSDGKRVIAKKSEEKFSKAVKVDLSRKRERLSLPDSSKRQKDIDATRKSLNKTSSAKLNKATKSEGKTSLGDKLYALINKESQPGKSDEEGKTKIVKSDRKETNSSQTLDATSKSRILSMMKDVKSSTTMETIVKQEAPRTHAYLSKFDKSIITLGKVEGSIEAIRAALQILDGGGKVEDAKAVCEPGLLAQIVKWRSKLRVYLAPFIYGMRYTSYGRHFTKVEKLREIVNMLHWYVQDGDMIVDFCCGSNDFSCLMKKKLDEIGKDCSYKNYDLFQPKNDFNFEKRDWMTVQSHELPVGSKLIMGLNPPFGVNAVLANKFINKALEFKPKLLILIVPKETERLDVKGCPYDLIWEDDALLGGKSFYLPGSVDQNDKQMDDWNVSAPPLYLWSRPDWTANHKVIAQQHGHPYNIKLEESCSDKPAPCSVKHDEDVSTRINNDIGFEDKKLHQHQEYKERLQNDSGKGDDKQGLGGKKSDDNSMKVSQDKSKSRSDDKLMKGSQDKSKSTSDKKSMKESQDRSKYQRDLDEKSRQDKSTAKRKRDLDENATEDKSIGKRSLSSSPSMTNHKSVDRHTISSSKAEENEGYQRVAGQSAAALQREQETGYGVHRDRDLDRRNILRTEEPYSGLTHQYPQSASPGPEYMGHRAHQDSDMARRNGLPMQEAFSSLNNPYSQSSSPGPEYAFRASDEQFVGYQRDHADIPVYRPYPGHRNGGIYARESDVQPQVNLYGQQGDEYLTPRSNYGAGAGPGYPHYGRLSPPTDPTYGRINTPVQQYAPHNELYPGRVSSVGSEGRRDIYGGGIVRPGFQGNSLGFAPRPYYPYSQQNSSGWLNE